MAGLVELVIAEDNETLRRKETPQKVNVRPIGEPEIIGASSSQGFWASEVRKYIERSIISQGALKGADAYVRGNTHVQEELWRVRISGGDDYYWLPIQYYKILDSNLTHEITTNRCEK